MLVTDENLKDVLGELSKKEVLAIDCETTGLQPDHGDRLFGISISDGSNNYYFNYQKYGDIDEESVLPRESIDLFKPLLADSKRLFVGANIKFDMTFLAKEGLYFSGPVYDVLVMARIERNDHLTYSLSSCAERIGISKDEKVMEYILKNHLWEWQTIPGKKSRTKKMYFDRVPISIMQTYAERDAEVTFKLYEHQRKVFYEWNESPKPIARIVENEIALTKVCFDMERRGLVIDRDYCDAAIRFETDRAAGASLSFKQLSGVSFVDSRKTLTPIFDKFDLSIGQTEKGNDSFTDDVLSKVDHPIAKAIQDYRDAKKKKDSYYQNFLHFCDREGVIRPNIRQSATATGRFSITEPALQTLNSEEETNGPFKIRSAFVARKGFKYVEIDFRNFEFKAAIDVSDERDMARAISGGHDPHQAAADITGLTRREAKTLTFLILYGGGAGKLSASLRIPLSRSHEIRNKYFLGLPRLRRTINECSKTVEGRGFLYTKFNRRLFFGDKRFAYKAFNYYCQSSTADAVKFAMVKIHDFLKPHLTRMVLQIHDSLLIEVADGEEHLISSIKKIMTASWNSEIIEMTVSQKEGKNWGNLHGR